MSVLQPNNWTLTADVVILKSHPTPLYEGELGWFVSAAYYRTPKGKNLSLALSTKVKSPNGPLTVKGPISIALSNWFKTPGVTQPNNMTVKMARRRAWKPGEETRAREYEEQLKVAPAA